jgi:hypothetical protein
MSLNWENVRAADVEKACSLIETGDLPPRPARGIFVWYKGQRLPAKHVLKLAYCIANRLPLDSRLKFASGEGTLKLLRRLGFEADRWGSSDQEGEAQTRSGH